MALLWRDEADGTVAMLMVVPMHKRGHPLAGPEQALERSARIVGAVFQGLK